MNTIHIKDLISTTSAKLKFIIKIKNETQMILSLLYL